MRPDQAGRTARMLLPMTNQAPKGRPEGRYALQQAKGNSCLPGAFACCRCLGHLALKHLPSGAIPRRYRGLVCVLAFCVLWPSGVARFWVTA